MQIRYARRRPEREKKIGQNMEEHKMYTVIEGGVTAAAGFQTASTAAGIKYKNRKDMALIYSEKPW